MDKPDLEKERHRPALRGLARINWWSRSANMLWRPICRTAADAQPLRVLDVATGAGDIPLRLWLIARKYNMDLEITGCDLSETALEYARSRTLESGANVTFFRLDALNDALPDDYDVITCSLFLHHLEEEQAVHLLRKVGHAARRMVLINDLRRSFWGWLFAWTGTRIVSRSPIVHRDGPLSVRAAFTTDEMRKLAGRAGLDGAAIKRKSPFRFLLEWRKC